jgi:flavodoxin
LTGSAVIVYESMFGNTHAIADAVGKGLEPILEVVVDWNVR